MARRVSSVIPHHLHSFPGPSGEAAWNGGEGEGRRQLELGALLSASPRAVTSLISCNLCSGFAHLTYVGTQLVGSKPCNEVRGGAGSERKALPLQVLVPSALPCASGKSASPGRTGGLARYQWRRASLSSTACKPAVRTLAAVANSNAPWGLAGLEGGGARERLW